MTVEVTHRCPSPGKGVFPCCGRTPFRVPETDRMTTDPELVTCQGAADMSATTTATRTDAAAKAFLARLQDWVDAERTGAEERVGSVETDDVLADARYDAVMGAYAGLCRAVHDWRRVAGTEEGDER